MLRPFDFDQQWPIQIRVVDACPVHVYALFLPAWQCLHDCFELMDARLVRARS
jgi:hypothetical protein